MHTTTFQNSFLPCTSGLCTFWEACFVLFFFNGLTKSFFYPDYLWGQYLPTSIITCKYLLAILPRVFAKLVFFSRFGIKLHIMLIILCIPKILPLEIQKIFFSIWGYTYPILNFIVTLISIPGDTQNSNGQDAEQSDLMLKSFLLWAGV